MILQKKNGRGVVASDTSMAAINKAKTGSTGGKQNNIQITT